MVQPTGLQGKEWWQAVRSIASLISSGTLRAHEDKALRDSLTAEGFSSDVIVTALEWVERALVSGHLHDSLSMLQSRAPAWRVRHPLEVASMHPYILRAVEAGRNRGLFTAELAERLLEGLRVIDTRDWTKDEVSEILRELVQVMAPNLNGRDVADLINHPYKPRH